MKRVIFALLLAMVIAPEVHAQTWPNEPPGSSVVVDCNFSSVTCGGQLTDVYNAGLLKNDPTAPFSAQSVLNQYWRAGTAAGGAQLDAYFNLKDLYVGFWWKLDPNFEGPTNNENKILFPGGYWIILMANGLPGSNFNLQPFFQFNGPNGPDNCHLPGRVAGDCPWSGAGAIKIGTSCSVQRDVWYRVEFYLRTSSTTNSRDGQLKLWANGTQCYSQTNVNTPSNLDLFSITHTWALPSIDWCAGSTWCGHTEDWNEYFDHVRISTGGSYSGVAPKGDTTPPAAPISLRAQ